MGNLPAGQFIITRTNATSFQEERRVVYEGNSSRAGVVTMSPTRTDRFSSKTGKPSTTAAVEWVADSLAPNKDIDFENYLKQVDRRIDVIGVSAIMKSIDDTATYANAFKTVFAEAH